MTFIAGIAAGFVAAYLLLHTSLPSTGEITTKLISGEKITHEDYDFTGKSIKFKTIVEGKGKAETEIPKTLIPEANSWMARVQSINLSFGYVIDFDDNASVPYFGILYNYRIDRVMLGCGIDASTEFIGARISAGLMF